MANAWAALQTLLKPLYFNVQLDITNACNLRCTHCYHSHHSNKGALTLAEWSEVILRVEAFSRLTRMHPRLILCGGEPLTSPHLFPLTELWMKKFPHSPRALLTNGILLDRPLPGPVKSAKEMSDLAAWVNKQGFTVQISLDGPDAGTHDQIRGAGNFSKTLKGIQRLVSLGTEVKLLAVLTRSSSSHIESFFRLARGLGVAQMNFERIVTQGFATDLARSESLRGLELKAALESILMASKKHRVFTSTQGPLWAAIDEELGSADTLGFYDWIISYRGEMKVSSRTDLILGHVLTDDPARVFFHHPLLKKLRSGSTSGCSSCTLYKAKKCAGNRNIAFAESGSHLAADPGCWRIPQSECSETMTHEQKNASVCHPASGSSQLEWVANV